MSRGGIILRALLAVGLLAAAGVTLAVGSGSGRWIGAALLTFIGMVNVGQARAKT